MAYSAKYSKKLLDAADNGDLEAVKQAIENGADINYKTTGWSTEFAKGTPALIIASYYNHSEIVEYLIAHEADINAKNEHDFSALTIAARKNHYSLAEMLINKYRDKMEDWYYFEVKSEALKSRDSRLTQILEKFENKKETPDIKESTANWERIDDALLIHTTSAKSLKLRISYVFNFKSREKFIYTENFRLSATTTTQPTSFQDLEETELQEAFNIFKDKGGKADEDYVFKGIKVVKKQHDLH